MVVAANDSQRDSSPHRSPGEQEMTVVRLQCGLACYGSIKAGHRDRPDSGHPDQVDRICDIGLTDTGHDPGICPSIDDDGLVTCQ